MPKKTIREAYLLLKIDTAGNVTARQVNVDDATNQYTFGDATVILAENEQALAKSLIRSMKTKLEQ